MISLFPYDTLKGPILNLHQTYGSDLGRYILSDDPSQNTLKLLINRVREHILLCETERTTQRDVFKQLVKEFESSSDKGADVVQEATLILLGALIHRYLRIQREILKLNLNINIHIDIKIKPTALFNFFFQRAQKDQTIQKDQITQNGSRLSAAIKKTLGLTEKNQLDAVTVVNSLLVFQNYMLQEQRHTIYPHFKDDANFKEYLEQIINEYKESGRKPLKQFDAIYFMQSIIHQLERDRVKFEEGIKELNKTPWENLTQELMQKHVSSLTLDEKKKSQLLIFINFYYESGKTAKDYEEFKTQLNDFLNINLFRCIICGGYVLLSESPECEDIRVLIKKHLGLKSILSSQESLYCLDAFEEYSASTPQLNHNFFGERAEMEKQISLLSEKFQEAENAEKPIKSTIVN